MSDRAIVLVGHGSHLNPNSSEPVRQHAAALQEKGLGEVHVAFWKEEPSLSRAFDATNATDLTVVPVFISTGYFTEQVIPREMRIESRVSEIDGRTVRYTDPVGAHPALARVIVQRAEEAGATGDEALAVLGHGTPRNPRSADNIYLQAGFVRDMTKFPEVTTVFIDQDPNMSEVFSLVAAPDVVMVPLFVADGWHVGETIPEDMALDGPETRREGRRLRYAAAVGTHPLIADVIRELVEDAWTW